MEEQLAKNRGQALWPMSVLPSSARKVLPEHSHAHSFTHGLSMAVFMQPMAVE